MLIYLIISDKAVLWRERQLTFRPRRLLLDGFSDATVMRMNLTSSVWLPGSADTVCPRPPPTMTLKLVKGKGAYSSLWNSPQNYGTPLVNGITQCYLPPDRGDRPAFTPTVQVGTRFIDPVRMKGWVGLEFIELVRESHLRWGTLLPDLGTLGLCVVELFTMYATDGQTDGQKQRLRFIAPFPTVGGGGGG